MMRIRKSVERGHAEHGWLKSFHTFSFADYYDEKHMGFRHLRVINEDFIKAGKGFGAHPHRDMEIVTYMISGALEHKDSLGNGSVITPGEIQYMSAGTGVMHSEFNPSATEDAHLLQIWILPDKGGYPPRYGQKRFDEAGKRGGFRFLVSPDGAEDSLAIRQDVKVYDIRLDATENAALPLPKGRHAWLQIVKGSFGVNGKTLAAGDAAAFSEEAAVALTGLEKGAEALLFDLS